MIELEPRDCPSVVSLSDLGRGYVERPDGSGAFNPFPDYTGSLRGLYSTNSGVAVYAPAAGSDGGPRVATTNAHGDRLHNDYFAFDPASRVGVAFVVLDDSLPAPPPPAPAVPAVTTGRGRLTYYLDFSQTPDHPADYVPAVVNRVAELLAPFDVTVTTVFPAAKLPGSFVTGSVLSGPQVPWFNVAAGGLATETVAEHANLEQPLDVYSGYFTEPTNTAHALAHEFGHALGLPHRNVLGNLMNGTVFNGGNGLNPDQVAAGNAAIDTFVGRVQ